MPLVIANWKMNFTLKNATDFCDAIIRDSITNNLVIAVPTLYLTYLSHKFPVINFCAQDVSVFEEYGPYTGECSAKMLFNLGVKYTIVGHSERRMNFCETNKIVLQKSIIYLELSVHIS